MIEIRVPCFISHIDPQDIDEMEQSVYNLIERLQLVCVFLNRQTKRECNKGVMKPWSCSVFLLEIHCKGVNNGREIALLSVEGV